MHHPVFVRVALVVTLVASACDAPAGRRSHAPPCPDGALDLPARSEAIVARLATTPEGAAMIEATRDRVGRICFGSSPGANAIDDEQTILLDRALEPGEAAARVGHLMMHVRDGSPYPERAGADADCDAIVSRALDIEARAHAFEIELRRAVGADGHALALPIEADFWAAPAADRVGLVRRWIAEHPDGGDGLDALASGYRARCESERAGARR